VPLYIAAFKSISILLDVLDGVIVAVRFEVTKLVDVVDTPIPVALTTCNTEPEGRA